MSHTHDAELIDVLRALGDKSRWRICQILLAHQEVCVGELVDKMGISQPLVSHHLKALRQAGLVKTRRQGNWIFYSLTPRRIERVIGRLSNAFDVATEATDSNKSVCKA